MNRMDFVDCGIQHIVAEDVLVTGAKLADVKCELIHKVDRLFGILGVGGHLLHNGLTTGSHVAPEHPEGIAADFWLDRVDNHRDVYQKSLDCGLRGFGLYWNGKMFTFHVDLREHHESWCWEKEAPGLPWTKKGPLIVDPR